MRSLTDSRLDCIRLARFASRSSSSTCSASGVDRRRLWPLPAPLPLTSAWLRGRRTVGQATAAPVLLVPGSAGGEPEGLGEPDSAALVPGRPSLSRGCCRRSAARLVSAWIALEPSKCGSAGGYTCTDIADDKASQQNTRLLGLTRLGFCQLMTNRSGEGEGWT